MTTEEIRQVLPAELTPYQKRCLRLVHDYRLFRRSGGWVAGFGGRVSLAVASQLAGMNLVRIDRTGRNPQLVLTGAGKNLHDVVALRRERKAA